MRPQAVCFCRRRQQLVDPAQVFSAPDWIISTAWNLQEPYGPQGEDEWAIENEADLREKLPEFYEVYQRTVGRIMVASSLETLREIGPTRAEEGR